MRLSVLDAERCVGCQSCMFACGRRFGVAGLTESRIGVRSAGGMSRGFRVVVCRACEDPPCAEACPQGALVPRKGGGVHLGAIYWNDGTRRPMICIHCGFCASYCPYSVLGIEKVGAADAQG
jgi:carbon-monoxide dehydrogenase iron sulfur subunit